LARIHQWVDVVHAFRATGAKAFSGQTLSSAIALKAR